jgi:PadR family transcriptional regulator PadR
LARRGLQLLNPHGEVVRGNLEVIVLSLIAARPIHGYAIILEIRKRFGVLFGPSHVYPLLNALEKNGFVRSELAVVNNKVRKVYHITREGLARLKVLTQTVTVIASQASSVVVG